MSFQSRRLKARTWASCCRSADIPVRSNVEKVRSRWKESASRGNSWLAADRNVRAPAWIALLCGVALGGCTVGPDYKAPEIHLQSSFGEIQPTNGAVARGQGSRAIGRVPPVAAWW